MGQPPLIVENFSGLRLGQDGVLGVNSRLGALEPHTIGVTVVTDLPGVMVYGNTRKQAVAKAQVLALRVLADRIEHGEKIPAIAKRFVAW